MRRNFSRLLLALALGVAASVAMAAATVTAADREAIRQVIADQLEALQRDDGRTAFSYAAPGIRAKFETPEKFMAMVHRSYRPLYRPREVTFWELVYEDGKPTQQLFVIGQDGAAAVALYEMQQQPDGSWRINGCKLIRRPGRPA